MKYLISKPLRNTISNFKNKLLGKTAPAHNNEYFNKYFLLQRDNKNWIGLPTRDDFNWSLYNLMYRGEREMSLKEVTLDLNKGDYSFVDGRFIQVNKKILPIHPNGQLMMETILQLDPKSVFELGCGNGIGLNNLKVISPGIKLFGIDRAKEQIKYLYECYPKLDANIREYDATVPFDDSFSKVDLAFSSAVIMHIKTGNSHLVALANLFNIAKKQVILLEHWHSHNFMKDIQNLFRKKIISWDKLYMYYRVSEENPLVRIMICSRYPLNYPILTDYKQLKSFEKKVTFLFRLKNWLKSY